MSAVDTFGSPAFKSSTRTRTSLIISAFAGRYRVAARHQLSKCQEKDAYLVLGYEARRADGREEQCFAEFRRIWWTRSKETKEQVLKHKKRAITLVNHFVRPQAPALGFGGFAQGLRKKKTNRVSIISEGK